MVLAAIAVMIRLGIWQLNRLSARRTFNARVAAQIGAPALELTGDALLADLTDIEYREVVVVGEYDHAHEVALRNQAWNNLPGYVLLTPLRIAGSDTVVLVNRGWVPLEDNTPDKWTPYAVSGVIEIQGLIRASQSEPDFGRRTDPTPAPGEVRAVWNLANVALIATQLPYEILPVYIQQAPDPSHPPDPYDWSPEDLPHASAPHLELSEGSHLGYAVQWFLFAAVLGFGYPVFLLREQETQNTHR